MLLETFLFPHSLRDSARTLKKVFLKMMQSQHKKRINPEALQKDKYSGPPPPPPPSHINYNQA